MRWSVLSAQIDTVGTLSTSSILYSDSSVHLLLQYPICLCFSTTENRPWFLSEVSNCISFPLEECGGLMCLLFWKTSKSSNALLKMFNTTIYHKEQTFILSTWVNVTGFHVSTAHSKLPLEAILILSINYIFFHNTEYFEGFLFWAQLSVSLL